LDCEVTWMCADAPAASVAGTVHSHVACSLTESYDSDPLPLSEGCALQLGGAGETRAVQVTCVIVA
jgi:hypothetical protein